jgi:uncharacterized protein YecT (DUF1311 family)
MTRLIFSAIFCLAINCCLGQTQAEMNKAAAADYQKADKELNSVYQQILKEYKADTAFIKNLKNSQRIWLQFRDAELKTKYPDRNPTFYGTAHPVCRSLYLAELTKERTEKLKVWVTGIEQENICAGSVKTKK